MTKLHLEDNMDDVAGVYKPTGKETTYPSFTAKPSQMVTLFEYYGKAQGAIIGMRVYETAVEDRIETGHKQIPNSKYPQVRTYPRTWLDKLDFIDQVHETGALSDKEIVEKFKAEHKTK